MRLLPYERLTLRSDDPPDVVQAKLATLIAPRRWFSLKVSPQPFHGTVQGRRFKVVRIRTILGIEVDNGSQPVIIGDVVPVTGGTEVRVRVRLQVFFGVFIAFWFGGLLQVGASMLHAGLKYGWNAEQAAGAGIGLVVFAAITLLSYTVTSVSFRTEVRKARAALCEGLACRVVEPGNRLLRP